MCSYYVKFENPESSSVSYISFYGDEKVFHDLLLYLEYDCEYTILNVEAW